MRPRPPFREKLETSSDGPRAQNLSGPAVYNQAEQDALEAANGGGTLLRFSS